MKKKIAVSQEKKYCEGMFGSYISDAYVLGIYSAVTKSKIKFSHAGSSVLDSINVFDLAEIREGNIGQINMIKVSSFCGPKGLIWGYDICRTDKKEPLFLGTDILSLIPVYDISPLAEAFTRLVGTVDYPRFPILPGSHVPCAMKSIVGKGECILYCALGLGIAMNREKKACLLMEDVGKIPHTEYNNKEDYKKMILRKLVLSILEVGRNQRIKFKEVFLGIKTIRVYKNEIACALVASPYIAVAEAALPRHIDCFNSDINEWERGAYTEFLYN